MNIAKISYLNAQPFFRPWPPPFHVIEGSPRWLAEQARAGKIDAGPLPLVDCWNMENEFDYLIPWGIAVREQSRSVFVLSKKPFSQIHHNTISVTQESSTSVLLCKILIEQRHGNIVDLRRGFHDEDQARLLIGDAALPYWINASEWPHVTDLATEWWRWTSLPFVFARWVIRRSRSGDEKKVLKQYLSSAIAEAPGSFTGIVQRHVQQNKMGRARLLEYLEGFIYQMGEEEEKAVQEFRRLSGFIKKPVMV